MQNMFGMYFLPRHLISSHLAYSLSAYEKCVLLFNLRLLLLECFYLTCYPNISSSCSFSYSFMVLQNCVLEGLTFCVWYLGCKGTVEILQQLTFL